jgi:hypothetical protein
MPAGHVFQLLLILGYAAWLLCFGAFIWPRLKAMEPFAAQRAFAALHVFRFFGLVFILPGIVSPHLPASIATSAAYGDLAAAILAMLALLTAGMRLLFWLFIIAFNLVGAADLILNYVHAMQIGLPERAAELGMAYAIPVLYVPILMITHIAAFHLMAKTARMPAQGHPA